MGSHSNRYSFCSLIGRARFISTQIESHYGCHPSIEWRAPFILKRKKCVPAELYIFYEPNEIAFCLRLGSLDCQDYFAFLLWKLIFFKLARFHASRKRYWNFILVFRITKVLAVRLHFDLNQNAWEDVEECMTFSNYVLFHFLQLSSSSSSSKRERTELWKAIQLIEDNVRVRLNDLWKITKFRFDSTALCEGFVLVLDAD